LTLKDISELLKVAPATNNMVAAHFTQIGLETEFISLINETSPTKAWVSTETSVTTDEDNLIQASCNAKGRTQVDVFTIAVCDERTGE
jgi:hypothetical protein